MNHNTMINNLFSQSALSDLLSMDRRTITKRLKDYPFKHGDKNAKLYCLKDVVSAFAMDFFSVPDVEGMTFEEARRRREAAQAGLAEIELQTAKGELVDTDKIMDLWLRRIVNLKTKLLNIPTKAAPLVVGKPLAKAKESIETIVHEVLNDIANSEPLAGIGCSDTGGHETSAEINSQ